MQAILLGNQNQGAQKLCEILPPSLGASWLALEEDELTLRTPLWGCLPVGSKAKGRGNPSLIKVDHEDMQRRVQGSPLFCKESALDHGVHVRKWNTAFLSNLCVWLSSSIPNKQGRSTFFIASLSTWMDPLLLEEILKSIYSPVSPSPAPPWDWGPLTNSIFPRFPSQRMATSFFWFLRPKSLKVSSDPFFLTHQIQPISIPCGLYFENGFRIQTTLATSTVTSLTYLESLAEQVNRSGNPTLLHSLNHVLCSKAVHLDKGHPFRFAPRCPVDRQLPRMLAHVTHLLKIPQ